MLKSNQKYYVELQAYGDFDMCYTESIMVGNFSPKLVFKSFDHPKMTNRDSDYISAYGNEEVVMKALKEHFESYGYSSIKTTQFSVGD